MSTPPCFTESEETDICDQYLSGISGPKLAKLYGCSSGAVYACLRRHGVKRFALGTLAFSHGEKERLIACERYVAGESARTIATDLNVGEETVRNWLRAQGIPRRGCVVLNTEEHLLAKELYEQGWGSTKIAAHFGVSYMAILNSLRKLDVSIRERWKSKYTCDETYFSNIDNQEKAYWIGFLAADGYITKHNTLACNLAIKDESHLLRLKNALKADHPIHVREEDGRYYGVIEICSQQMVSDLAQYSITKRKSATVEWVGLDPELQRHYLRGCFDGDGWFTSKATRTGRQTLEWGLHGNKKFIIRAQKYLMESCSLKKTKLRHFGGYCTVRYGGNGQCVDIACHLYRDASVFLQRKYDVVLDTILGDSDYVKLYGSQLPLVRIGH